MSTSADVLFPPILWAQRSDFVFVTIALSDAADVSIEILENGRILRFSATSTSGGAKNPQRYGCDIELFRNVSSEESRHVTLSRQIEIVLKKLAPGCPFSAAAEEKEKTEKDNKKSKEEKEIDDEEIARCRAWPRLTKEKTKNAHIQVDWSRWKDDDDESENDDEFNNNNNSGGGGGGFGMNYEDIMSQMMMQQQQSADEENEISENVRQTHADEEFDDLPPLEE